MRGTIVRAEPKTERRGINLQCEERATGSGGQWGSEAADSALREASARLFEVGSKVGATYGANRPRRRELHAEKRAHVDGGDVRVPPSALLHQAGAMLTGLAET